MIVRFHNLYSNAWFRPFEVQNKDGEIETIKLVQGTSEVRASKQDKNAKPKEFMTGVPTVIVDGVSYYEADITDAAVLKFLQAHPAWGSQYIFEYDPLKESKQKSEELQKQVKTLMEVTQLDEEGLLKLGYAKLFNAALEFAKNKDYEGLRMELAAKTQEDPEGMESLLHDKSNADKLFIGLAFAKGVLIEVEAGNGIAWGDNEAKIISVRNGETTIDALLEYFKEPEGREVKKLIHTKVTADKKTAPKEKANEAPAK